ncbi:MAG: glycoside hydrolase family 2 TIM barrel-domain containing protein [Bacillota bacterium]|nr:glycoside hydrolase family 2 TIM barrel-domain containing protein [Bacillota bacterium]
MKKVETHDFIYYTGEKDRPVNFNGQESFSIEQRLEFLNKYQENARKWYDDPDFLSKAATDTEVDAFLDNYSLSMPKVRKVIPFDTMTAYKKDEVTQYRNLHLYCGAKFTGEEIILDNQGIRPNPSVKYEFPAPLSSFTIAMDIFIPKDYKSTQATACGHNTSGRVIELRCGTLDRVKVKFFCSGLTRAYEDKWIPRTKELSPYKFGEYNHLEINVGENITISLNGIPCESPVGSYITGPCDNLFLDSGMLSKSFWKVKNIEIDGEKINFEKNISKESATEIIGEVSLPYAIGSHKNKDKELYLEKTFTIDNFEKAVLSLTTLDPYGKAWLNDNLILDTNTFEKSDIDVTKFLKKGENRLKIMVKPRGPEVYCFWHRHNDCYFGWLCGEVYLTLTKETHFNELTVITHSAADFAKGTVKLSLNKPFKGTVKVTAEECYPGKSEAVTLASSEIENDSAVLSFEKDLKLWSSDNPVLYAVRAILIDENGNETDDLVEETGFRTVESKDGAIYINGHRQMLNGALLMQFLPPFDQVPVNHTCPLAKQIAWQIQMLKNMNGNFLRLHMLGYGSNDKRYARICDRLGIMLIWTTRYIDTLESLVWPDPWSEKEQFKKQMKDVLNHPSIVVWEGSNEFYPKNLFEIDRMYDDFIDTILSVDKTRLICPCSHLYYDDCVCYNDAGTKDKENNDVMSGHGWRHPQIIRSAHPYVTACGYGQGFERMRKQDLDFQPELFKSKEHAYLATEFAVTSLPNPNTPEAKVATYYDSYERGCEPPYIGRVFEQSEWAESQALAAFCAFNAVKIFRSLGVDGMTWCCLSSGANNGSYMKPPIDFYGYKKIGFYSLKDAFNSIFASKKDINVAYGTEDSMTPILLNSGKEGTVKVTCIIYDEEDNITDTKVFEKVSIKEKDYALDLPSFKPNFKDKGYYTIKWTVE